MTRTDRLNMPKACPYIGIYAKRPTGRLNVPKARPYIGIYAKRPTGRLNVPKARPYMGKSRITLTKNPAYR